MSRNLDFNRPRRRHDGASISGVPEAMRAPPRPHADRAAMRRTADDAVAAFVAAGGIIRIVSGEQLRVGAELQADRERKLRREQAARAEIAAGAPLPWEGDSEGGSR